jgi:type IV secretion system protein TrbG
MEITMKRIILVTSLLALNATSCLAEAVTPPTVDTARIETVIVPDIKRMAVEKWARTGVAASVRERDGQTLFPYGESQPVVNCSVNHVCDIELQKGESIRNVAAGDTVRWYIQPAESGAGGEITPHVIVKPTQAGLETNIILTTDKRTYYLTLRSSEKEYVTRVGFYYPRELVQSWSQESKAQAEKKAATVAEIPSIEKLDFDYSLSGTAPFKPERVFNDGLHVYIQMGKRINSGEAPALMLVDSKGNTQLVNYRMSGSYYIVDRLFDRAVLVLGTGRNAQKIEITRKTASCFLLGCFNGGE